MNTDTQKEKKNYFFAVVKMLHLKLKKKNNDFFTIEI